MTYLRSGIFLAPFHALKENPILALERDMELLQHLDALNYSEAWIGEHHSGGFEIISSPEVFIASFLYHIIIRSFWPIGWCNWTTRPVGGRCWASGRDRWCMTRRRSASSRWISDG
jgi:hypothetical protein